MKKVIVTGANGFVGSHLVNSLSADGVFVYAVVRNEFSDISRLEKSNNIKIIYHDFIKNRNFVEKFKNIKDIDVLYYLAWAGTSGDMRADYNLQLSNVSAVCESVKDSKKLNIKNFIYAGSIMEYECMDYIPRNEATPGLGNIYSIAKLSAHFMAKTLAKNIGVNFMNLVISNIYGPGEFSARLINTSLLKMLAGERCDFTEGKQLYDFIYIDDAIRAIKLVGTLGKNGHEYYIGNEQQKPLKEFLIEMKNVVNPDLELNLGAIAFNGPLLDYNELNTKGLYEELNFETRVSFKEGILKTLEWLKNRS